MVGPVRYGVFHGVGEDLIATLVFQDDKLVDTEYVVPSWWDRPADQYGQPFLLAIKRSLSPEEFQRSHSTLVMVPEALGD